MHPAELALLTCQLARQQDAHQYSLRPSALQSGTFWGGQAYCVDQARLYRHVRALLRG